MPGTSSPAREIGRKNCSAIAALLSGDLFRSVNLVVLRAMPFLLLSSSLLW